MKRIFLSLLTFMLVFTCIQIPANAVEVDDIYNVTDAAEIDYEMVYDGYRYNDYIYYTFAKNVYEYNMKTKTTKTLDIELPDYNRTGVGIRDSILYVGTYLHQTDNEEAKYNIIGIDLSNSYNIVYNENLDISLAEGSKFILDSKHNFYVSDDRKVMIINKNGEILDEVVFSGGEDYQFYLTGISPNDKILFYTVVYYVQKPYFVNYEGFFPLENNRFVSEDFYIFNEDQRAPKWSFSNDSKYAVSQYGELAEFDYDYLSESKRGYNIIYYTGSKETSLLNTSFEDDYAYIYSDSGTVSMYNILNEKVEKTIKFDKDIKIKSIYPMDNEVGFIYEIGDMKYYFTTVSKNEFTSTKEITINTHSTLNKTKEEVKAYYNENKITANYTSENIYESLPVLTAPYYEGKLKDNYVNDILKQLNMFRWMSGLSCVTLNEQYMPRSQKGALILAASNELTHTPSKLPGMDDDFYQEAFAGTYAGYDYEGNVLDGYDVTDVIKSFVDDDGNGSGGVGHRSSMLSIYATSMSFGVAHMTPYYHYGATSIYTDNTMTTNNEDFYAWPNAGYCPIELTNIYAQWSIRLNDKYNLKTKDVILTYNNKDYKAEDIGYDAYNKTIYYSLPEELKALITKDYKFINNTTIQVKVSGVTDKSGNNIHIEYPVKLFIADDKFPFEDVFEGQWYYEYVDQAYQLGLMTGASDSLFKPTVSMNRGMVAIVLHRMEGAKEVAFAPIFPDVYDKQYFTTAVMWAKQTGIITGYSNGTFMPLKEVTREEMATMIQRFAKYKGLDVTSSKDITYFQDYADISTYAKAPIQWCVENGVLSGKFEGTKVDPLGTASRAECAKMLVQAYKVIYK